MDKQTDLKRQLSAVDMELREKLDTAEKEERVSGAKIMALKAGMTSSRAATSFNPEMAQDDDEQRVKNELGFRLREENERLRDIKIRKRETNVGANIRKSEIQKELEMEKHKERNNIFLSTVGLSGR